MLVAPLRPRTQPAAASLSDAADSATSLLLATLPGVPGTGMAAALLPATLPEGQQSLQILSYTSASGIVSPRTVNSM